MKICHITTVHQRYDIRIFYKECLSLAKEHKVSLIVADGLESEISSDINIIDIGLRQKMRIKRFLIDTKKALRKARELDCDVYHFHDPELVFVGLLLRKLGKKVICDIHEILSAQILLMDWIPGYMRRLLSVIYKVFERKMFAAFDFLLVPQIEMKSNYLKINRNTETIFNYVNYEGLIARRENDKTALIYVGGLSVDRGIYNMLDLLNILDLNYSLTLAGGFNSFGLYREVRKHAAWSRVNYLGYIGHNKINSLYLEHTIGLVLFNNVGQYDKAFSLKLFEYMKYGLTVMVPNFGDWINFNIEHCIGYNVDPKNYIDMRNVLNNISKEDLRKIGNNNMQLIEKEFNWDSEEKKLLRIYREMS